MFIDKSAIRVFEVAVRALAVLIKFAMHLSDYDCGECGDG
jgi:hypothetical protein